MENFKNLSNETQRELIKDFIQTELLKRGFHAPIVSFEETKHGFAFTTEEFQTTPVIFKSIRVTNFNSFIGKEDYKNDNTDYPFRNFSIQVHVSYDNFSGGSNGTELFTVFGELAEGTVYDLSTK